MEELSIQYFRELLDKHIKELKGFCKEWEGIGEDQAIPEDVKDEIRTTIGLTNLLLRQKLKQFGELIDDSECKRGEKEITCIDLQGFWDMVFHEVEKIQKSFKNLKKCQNNNWVLVQEPLPKVEPKKVGLKNKATLSNTSKNIIAAKTHAVAARQRLAEAKQRMREANKKTQEANGNVEVEISVAKDNLPSQLLNNGFKTDSKTAPETVKNILSIEDKEETSLRQTSKKSSTVKSNKKNILTQDVNVQHKKQKHEKSAGKDKENVAEVGSKKELLTVPVEKVPTQRKKRSKPMEVIPLQCVTRSARRAMLLQQNE